MSELFKTVCILVAGVAAAGVGGEAFVRGATGLARRFRIAPMIIGATVAAFATSSPEMTVAVAAAVDGAPGIALGDALGSNVINAAMIVGIALLLGPIKAERRRVAVDYRVAIAAPLVVGILLWDGLLSRPDAVVLLAVFIAWLARIIFSARRAQARGRSTSTSGDASDRAPTLPRIVLQLVVGLTFLVVAGRLIVVAGKDLGAAFGLPPLIVGATIVAIGTSMPEIATVLVSRVRGHDDIALGTIFGSNIFNQLAIVPVAALIVPIEVPLGGALTALIAGVIAVAFLWPDRNDRLGRSRAWPLLTITAAYFGAQAFIAG